MLRPCSDEDEEDKGPAVAAPATGADDAAAAAPPATGAHDGRDAPARAPAALPTARIAGASVLELCGGGLLWFSLSLCARAENVFVLCCGWLSGCSEVALSLCLSCVCVVYLARKLCVE